MTEHQERIAKIRALSARHSKPPESAACVVLSATRYAEDTAFLLAQLDAAQADTRRLTDAVRWALGEEGDFSDTPDDLREIIRTGCDILQRRDGERGRRPIPRLYWWRGELRRKAFAGVSPEATEGNDA